MPFLRYTAVSRTAARALEEFSDAMRGALAIAEPQLWAAQWGLVVSTDAIKMTFPIPLDAAGYKEFKGDIKYRSVYSRALSMIPKKWTDGVEELAEVVEAPDFIDWAGQPGKIAREWLRLPDVLAAGVLEANPLLDFYRDPDTNTAGTRHLFAGDHPNNVLIGAGSFNNDRTTTVADILSGQFFKDASTYYAGIKGPNGQPMGLRLSGGSVLTSLNRDQLFEEALKQDSVIRAIDNLGKPAVTGVVAVTTQKNRFQNYITHITANELTSTSDDYFYTLANGNDEAVPFVIMQGATPEEILHDKTSSKYKEHLKIGMAYVGAANVAAALPHRIARWHITA